MNDVSNQPEISMNAADMWREETFTDNAVGTLRRLTPVTAEGNPDETRSVRYYGSTQVMTNAGPLPLQFELQGNTLAEAIGNFGDAAKIAFDQTMDELREYQRQQAGSIVVPKGGVDPGAMGGMGGGGKIQMP